MKIIITIALIIIAVPIVLNFIPIKFAKKIDNLTLKEGEYLCQVELKTVFEEKWGIFKSLPINYSDECFVNLSGKIPFDSLNPEDFSMKSNKENQFLVTGDLTITGNAGIYEIGELNVKEWDIVYPIQRSSFRQGLTPKGYLTFYDYDWITLLKKWFEK